MQIHADRDRCEGHGLCEEAAPEIYRLDDDAVVTVLLDQVPSHLEDKAASGARACPVAALRVTS